MKLAILGFGREGKSVFKFLRRMKALRGDEVWILDRNPKIKIPKGARGVTGKNYLKNLLGFDVIFRSPGIPYNLPELRRARKNGVVFSSATKLFFANCPAQVIGITGTKGKGTTATILYNILKKAGEDVFLAGNIGTPALDLLPKIATSDKRPAEGEARQGWQAASEPIVILELSSFQLQDLEVSPHIAVVLEIFPDHLDAHANLKEYYGAKANIAAHQKSKDTIFYFKHDKLSRWIGEKSMGKKIPIDLSFSNSRELENEIRKVISIPGEHNFKNAAMAAIVALKIGVSRQAILQAIKNFKGNEHRLELVRTIGNIRFYNDSASTNPHTTAAAIRAFQSHGSGVGGQESGVKNSMIHDSCPGTQILIAGGRDKVRNYAPLVDAIKKYPPKLIVLMGENKNKIRKAIMSQGSMVKGQVKIEITKNLREAVRYAYRYAMTNDSYPITHIIFSPGATSFDMFANYAERGREFKKIVKLLTRKRFNTTEKGGPARNIVRA
ncbi:MAG: UDP-N-acetylmuramoyl-L-alanine--D-glutamate ligase [Patescibacteria group bacterium]